MRIFCFGVIFFLGSVLLNCEVSAGTVEKGREFARYVINRNFEKARLLFDKTMTQVVSEQKFNESVEYLYKVLGEFKEITGARTEEQNQFQMVFVDCAFEKAHVEIKVVFDKSGKVTGYFYVPVQKVFDYNPPAYASKPGEFVEIQLPLENGKWKMPGILTLPAGEGPFPAVVLVHGSGPNDMDETIGPNKPFKDLALGLVAKGIAVYRYDKRTKVHPDEISKIDITLSEEVIDDAVHAAEILIGNKKIDPQRLYVLGHSLGGEVIPRIATNSERYSGYIIMAGATRHLLDMMLEQYSYIFSLDGKIDEMEQKTIDDLKKDHLLVKALKKGDSPSRKIMGIPASYWLDIQDYNPPESAKSIEKPILVLQGGRDYQVTDKDLGDWERVLKKKNNARFRYYPSLNHLFISGAGIPQPTEYSREGHVSEEVIEDISIWINRQK